MIKKLSTKLFIYFGLIIVITGGIIGIFAEISTTYHFSLYMRHRGMIEEGPSMIENLPRILWPHSPEQSFIQSMSIYLLIALLIALFISFVLSYLISHRLTTPIKEMTEAASKLAKGDLSQRVETTSADEIGQLSQTFNLMASNLEEFEELRKNMCADIAHELRTPLTTIQGYLEALKDGVVKPERKTLVSIHEESLLLSRLVNDLQDLSLAEAKQLKLIKEPANLDEIVEKVVNGMKGEIEENGLKLEIKISKDLPPVMVDANRISQVFRNLLKNAINFTPAGGLISIKANKDGSFIKVSFSDTGIGIEEKDLPYIFERFYRVDESRSKDRGGAGLGLAVVKYIIEAHQGKIEAKSKPGEGTTFIFTLPLAED